MAKGEITQALGCIEVRNSRPTGVDVRVVGQDGCEITVELTDRQASELARLLMSGAKWTPASSGPLLAPRNEETPEDTPSEGRPTGGHALSPADSETHRPSEQPRRSER